MRHKTETEANAKKMAPIMIKMKMKMLKMTNRSLETKKEKPMMTILKAVKRPKSTTNDQGSKSTQNLH